MLRGREIPIPHPLTIVINPTCIQRSLRSALFHSNSDLAGQVSLPYVYRLAEFIAPDTQEQAPSLSLSSTCIAYRRLHWYDLPASTSDT